MSGLSPVQEETILHHPYPLISVDLAQYEIFRAKVVDISQGSYKNINYINNSCEIASEHDVCQSFSKVFYTIYASPI